jgi:hypothetical protein
MGLSNVTGCELFDKADTGVRWANHLFPFLI